jgi:hypothetical protein
MVHLAEAILAIHVLIIVFNVGGLIVIPLGAWRHWAFVRVRWWRVLHLASLAIVAVQAIWGRACFLTIWQSDLQRTAGQSASESPLIQRWVEHVVFWPVPLWVFTALYVLVFAYTVALWWLVPPKRRDSGSWVVGSGS